jgi:hypothetical protein
MDSKIPKDSAVEVSPAESEYTPGRSMVKKKTNDAEGEKIVSRGSGFEDSRTTLEIDKRTDAVLHVHHEHGAHMEHVSFTDQIKEFLGGESQMPTNLFVGSKYITETENGAEVEYHLNLAGRLYITFEDSKASITAFICCKLVLICILLSTVVGILGSIDAYQDQPTDCEDPTCVAGDALCPNSNVCAPEAIPVLETIETICLYIFTADYAVCILTCAFIPTR